MLRAAIRVVGLWMLVCPVTGSLSETDDAGRVVTLASAAERIVSLSPHITEILFDLGVGDRIVATVRFSDHPQPAREIPRVGDAFSVNVEAIVNMQPDIVFAWATGGADRALDRLRSLGVPVYVNEAKTLPSIVDNVRGIARLVGREERGERLAGRFLQELEDIRRQAAGRESVTVFFQISDRDLYTVNGAHLIGQAIELCGGSNPFADSPVPVPRVSQEAVLAAEPDVIIISQPAGNAASPWIEKWSQHESLESKIRTIDPDLISRPSLRMLEGVRLLCGLI